MPSCEFDYLATGRREFGLDTLDFEKRSEIIKEKGEQKCKFKNSKNFIKIFLSNKLRAFNKKSRCIKTPYWQQLFTWKNCNIYL